MKTLFHLVVINITDPRLFRILASTFRYSIATPTHLQEESPHEVYTTVTDVETDERRIDT